MFSQLEQPPSVSPSDYRQRVRQLRRDLLQAQVDLRSADFSFIVVFGGVDGGGKGETANLLNEWMDPRHIVTQAFLRPSDEEAERPEFWRFWMSLPAHGQIGVFLRAWYSKPLLQRAYQRTDESTFDGQLTRIVDFERTLTSAGTRILKFWMHLGKEDQAERLRALEADPLEAWRVTELDWKHWGMYGSFIDASKRLIERTDVPSAPWKIVDGRDPFHRSLTVGGTLLEHLRSALDGPVASPGTDGGEAATVNGPTASSPEIVQSASGAPRLGTPPPVQPRPLDRMDLDRSLPRALYK
ncbi:MAG: polyphosphate kinase, partial [Gemmatimonadetes bacterium]|nr:polyphosphate kinase [Gemmatimonadota bacterium]